MVPVLQCPTTVTEVQVVCDKHNVDAVICCNEEFLKKLVPVKNKVTLDNYEGSIIKRNPLPITKKPLEFLICNPLTGGKEGKYGAKAHLHTVPYQKHLLERYLTKFTNPSRWWKTTDFIWEVAKPSTMENLYEEFKTADYIAQDTETATNPLRITVAGYCAVYIDNHSIRTKSIVIHIDDLWAVSWMRRFNQLPQPKIFQNGLYDNAYYTLFDAPVTNYLFDTINLFHCWYSELPKDLGFISSYCLRDVEFWKADSATVDKYEYYKYNARDTWGTANAFLSLMREMPAYAFKNYILEFPTVFPNHACSCEGWKIDQTRMVQVKQQEQAKLDAALSSIKRMVSPFFNPSSPLQCLRLLHAFGNKDLKGAGEKEIKKAMLRHPFTGRIFQSILNYRKSRKLHSTYTPPDEDAEGEDAEKGMTLYHGRVLYSLLAHGTDSGRNACKEHYYWLGLQIQNIPRGGTIKQCFISDEDLLLGEADFDQAEARDTAYLSGDTTLIRVIEDITKDFHSYNCAAFTGRLYEAICRSEQQPDGTWKHTRLDIPIIDIFKRVNHGSNYNIGAKKLVDTMGLAMIWEAQKTLKLPGYWEPEEVAQHLLDVYAKTYSVVKGAWYDYVVYQVLSTNTLVSPFGWTRYCFANPKTSKPALNAYVAHPPQNLNAGTLNRAFLKIFLEVQLPNWNNFRLKAQIHDSIPFQYRRGFEHLAWKVKEIMEEKFDVVDCGGKKRTVKIPVTLKLGAERWSEIK